MNASERNAESASPGVAFWYTSAITLVLVTAANSLPWYRCSPFHGIFATILAMIVLPWLVVPVLAVPGAIAALVVKLLRRGGARRAWRRVLLAAVSVLVAVMAVATVAALVAPGRNCDLS